MRNPERAAQILGDIDHWRQWPIEAQVLLLEELRRRQGTGHVFRNTYRNDPAAFARDCIEWGDDHLTLYQEEILSEIPNKKRVSVRGPHGLGKTCVAAIALIWFALTRDGDDWKIPTTASAWRQLTEFFWPEIHKWTRAIKWDKIQRDPFNQNELQSQLLKLSTGRAFAMASSDDELTEGAHADHLLYIFDEAKAIPIGRWDAAEGALMTGEAYALAISTPGEPVGRFYDIQSRKPGYEDWWVRHVTLEECIEAGRITAAQARQRALQWGEQSAVYQNRVLGEFCASDEDAVIPLAWIEAANERWLQRIELLGDDGEPITNWNWNDGAKRCVWPRWRWKASADTPNIEQLGVDIARSDLGDKTVNARRQGDTLTQLDRYHIADTQPIVGYVSNLLEKSSTAIAVVDVIGIGSGPYDQLRERFGNRAVAFNASESTDFKDRSEELEFSNKRSAAWWHMREILDPAYGSTIALPPDDQLTGDLTAPHRGKMTSGGKLTVESKPEIRKRIGRSTDDADATVMAFWPKPKEAPPDETYSYSYINY